MNTYHQIFIHPPTHLDKQVHLVSFLKATGDVVILEAAFLSREPVDVCCCPLGQVVVILKKWSGRCNPEKVVRSL